METILNNKSRFSVSPKTKMMIVDVVCYLFIILFIYTATNKIWKFGTFERVMMVMPVIGMYGKLIAYFIPGIEILISLLLVIPRLRKIGLFTSFVLMIVFTVYLIFMLFYAKDLPCNCGGVISKMSWSQHIFFNIGFIILAALGIKLY